MKKLSILLKGIVVGFVSCAIPGVSASTFAIILGVYYTMIESISMILKNMERDKYAKVIHEELNKLSVEFSRYKDRWDKLARTVKSVNQSIDELHTTSEKITKRFDSINSVDLDKLGNKEDTIKIETY